MVRPPKPGDLTKPANNFRRVTKKGNIKNPEIEEKYRNKASILPKSSDKKKIHAPFKKLSEEDFSSTPPSIRKSEQISPKISVKLSKRSSQSITNRTNKNRVPVSGSAPKDGAKRTISAGRTQKSRLSQSKNKIPAIAKSEPMKRLNDKETNKKQKHKGKNNNPSPPPDSYFKAEGKLRTSSQPNKVIGRLITPKIMEERHEKVEQELKHKNVNKIDNSNVSLMTHYCVGLKSNHALEKKEKPLKYVRKFRKSKIPARKLRKTTISKSDLKKPENSDKKSKKSEIKPVSSDEKPIVREIKHNDSFVISAKKLQNSARTSKRQKPEIIRLFKRKDVHRVHCDNNALKSCLKKNSDGNPKESFGEGKVLMAAQVKRLKNSQIPRLSREKPMKNN